GLGEVHAVPHVRAEVVAERARAELRECEASDRPQDGERDTPSPAERRRGAATRRTLGRPLSGTLADVARWRLRRRDFAAHGTQARRTLTETARVTRVFRGGCAVIRGTSLAVASRWEGPRALLRNDRAPA